jgi:hypothetical protein
MKVDGIAAGRDETPLGEQGVSSGTTSRDHQNGWQLLGDVIPPQQISPVPPHL